MVNLNSPARAGTSWTDLATADADEPASMQRRWMPIRYDQVDRGIFTGRYRELNIDGISIASEQQNRTVLKRQYFPAGACSVSVIRDISTSGRCELDMLDKQTIGYMPGNRQYEILMPPSDILFLRLDPHRVMEAADLLGSRIPGDGRGTVFVNGLEPGSLLTMADTLMNSLGASAPAREVVAPGYVEQLVMSHVVGLMASMSPGSGRISSGNTHRIARAAQALIDGADDPLTVMDLCRELSVSRATLQRSFEQCYGVSPLVYLRMHRLNAARRALIAASESDETVTSIAMRWGFFHLARFAKDYRDQFGELPSVTLRQARAR